MCIANTYFLIPNNQYYYFISITIMISVAFLPLSFKGYIIYIYINIFTHTNLHGYNSNNTIANPISHTILQRNIQKHTFRHGCKAILNIQLLQL